VKLLFDNTDFDFVLNAPEKKSEVFNCGNLSLLPAGVGNEDDPNIERVELFFISIPVAITVI
jgi:hypothetical protein